ncbi:MAG: histidine kinase dimerization/phospho-acceptor domain-containing protein [Bacteroidota bacterium]
MEHPPRLLQSLKEIPMKYPAVISGYIIYSYLFYTLIRFFIIARESRVTFQTVFEMFDALPFMWLLAIMLVKVIDIKTRLYESERLRMLHEKELNMKETQITTMREVTRGLQHHINNPLAIIILTLSKVKRLVSGSPEVTKEINSIEEAAKRITKALKDFGESDYYKVEQIGSTVGAMTVPSDTAE